MFKREPDILLQYQEFDFISLDEMRLGLMTDFGKKITLRGVKPIGKHQHLFLYQYLSGAISLSSGEHWILQQDACNGVFFQELLNAISKSKPKVLKIIILDNGSFHKNKALVIPDNIRLIFLPAYSPELNPIERFWQEIRRFLKNKVFACIDDLMNETKRFLDQCTPEFCRSVVGYHFYDKVLAILNMANK